MERLERLKMINALLDDGAAGYLLEDIQGLCEAKARAAKTLADRKLWTNNAMACAHAIGKIMEWSA